MGAAWTCRQLRCPWRRTGTTWVPPACLCLPAVTPCCYTRQLRLPVLAWDGGDCLPADACPALLGRRLPVTVLPAPCPATLGGGWEVPCLPCYFINTFSCVFCTCPFPSLVPMPPPWPTLPVHSPAAMATMPVTCPCPMEEDWEVTVPLPYYACCLPSSATHAFSTYSQPLVLPGLLEGHSPLLLIGLPPCILTHLPCHSYSAPCPAPPPG